MKAKKLINSLNSNCVSFVVNPEFLREGNAINDILYPSRVIIGGDDEESIKIVASFWEEFYRRIGKIPPILVMSSIEAALVKLASNAFLAMKVVFANIIANVCEETGLCDAYKVLEGVGLDPRIGGSHLRPGMGFGGPCLPKDLKLFIGWLKEVGLDSTLFEIIMEMNSLRNRKIIEIIKAEYGNLKGLRVAVLGLAYKPYVDDVRGSPSVKLIEELIGLGAVVKAHDPEARVLTAVQKIFKDRVILCNDLVEALRDVDAVIIGSAHDMYRSLKPRYLKRLMKGRLIVDYGRVLDGQDFIKEGFKYCGAGMQCSYKG
jgi:UDPglucose 6-dehydrogenase